MMADYVAMTDVSGRLVTLCDVCERSCNRMMRAADIPGLSRILDIAMSDSRNA